VDAVACRESRRGKRWSQRSRPDWINRRPWAARVPGWFAALAAGVWHASTVRPDPSTLGAVGERGSHYESCSQLVPGFCYAGRSELTALRVGRLDLLHGTARVVEAAPEVDGRLHWGGVKTHEARTVRLPRSISEELGAYLAARPRDPEALMFTAPLGGPLRPHTWIKHIFKPALRAAGLPETLRLYDLRHTCASLLIAQGASVKAVQAQLGHATASITLDTYGHLFPSELEALADRLEQTRMAALANRERTQRGPAVVTLAETAVGSAEEVGFEPTGPSRVRRLSRSLPSAARPLLRAVV
jgi:hypothetical protein